MSYFPSATQARLQQAFATHSVDLEVREDLFVVQNSQKSTNDKIREIVESAGFCPFIFPTKIDRNFAFTLTPYKIPEFFEICQLLEPLALVENEGSNPKESWVQVNSFRAIVRPALNKALTEIVSRYDKGKNPIVEIGCGKGYELAEHISKKTIKIQPDLNECQMLRKETSDPIYHTDIKGLYDCLLTSGKKIPLVYALSVFDTMNSQDRMVSFSQISNLQQAGDRILIMHDTNPLLDVFLELLDKRYPDHAVFPYFPLLNRPAKFSVIMIPLEIVKSKLSSNEFAQMMEEESMTILQSRGSEMQNSLQRLQRELDLDVIVLEDFFVEQVKGELNEIGYATNVFYHHSFEIAAAPTGEQNITEDLLYKSVTDTCTVRQWSLRDANLIDSLAQKGLTLPHFDESFLRRLRATGQKIFGAQILVIEAQKK